LGGALFLATRKNAIVLPRVIGWAAAIFGTGLVLFSFSHVWWLSLLFLLIVGFGMMVQMASSNTVLQTIVHDDKRGRIMSFYTMAFMGMAPFGNLIAGSMASRFGASYTVMAGGICCICGAFLYSRYAVQVHHAVDNALGQKEKSI
jgi:MFS family permease